MEVDNQDSNTTSSDCILMSEPPASPNEKERNVTRPSATPMTPVADSAANSTAVATPSPSNLSLTRQNKSRSVLTPAEKAERERVRIENAKKKQEEKEKKDRERKEREEALKKKKEEEEQLRLKKQEELRIKKEEKRIKEEEERVRKEAEKERLAQERAERERQKLEQQRKREEEKKQRDDERKQKEEEKQREEEEKRKKAEKVKNQFESFFIKKDNKDASPKGKDEQKSLRFMPFQPKKNMRIAPVCRRDDIVRMTAEEKEEFIENLDKLLAFNKADNDENQATYLNYLEEIKGNKKLIRKQTKGCRRLSFHDENSKDQEIVELTSTVVLPIVEANKFKVKYLHFDPKTYKRPPYYGTWRHKSKFVKPRAPFAKDEKLLNYEIDSDDEWEDEPEGESIADSVGDDEEEVIDDEDDDGFFVPHGHLSDDELDEDERILDPEIKKAREAAKKEQWEMERKSKSKVLIPKFYINTSFWSDDTQIVSSKEFKLLERLQMVPLATNFPIQIHNETLVQNKSSNDEATANATPKSKNSKVNNLNNNNLNESSPKNSKSKKNQQASNNNTTSASSSPAIANTTTPAEKPTPTILKLFSKMTNKNVKLEQVSNNNNNSNDKSKAEKSENKAEPNTSMTAPIKPVILTNTPTILNDTVKTVTTSASKKRVSLTPLASSGASPKTMTPNSSANPVSEKRVCSGNGENAVKRLKIDTSQAADSNGVQTLSIVSLFNKSNGSARKSLKLESTAAKSESSDESAATKNGKENQDVACILIDD